MQTAFIISFCFLTLSFSKVLAIIISPCKVQNLVTQPSYGTSLKTKSLVQIIQMPPVFVQNVMIGICQNQNQNVSTGRIGEFYTCEQRYSVVEVYIAEASSPATNKADAYQKVQQQTPDILNSMKFIRESVIIESGCDFTFNLLPLISGQSENQQGGQQALSPQQGAFLRSPYHPTIPLRRPDSTVYTQGRAGNEDDESSQVSEDEKEDASA